MNFKSILEFETLVEGYNFCRLNGPTPFVVRNSLDFIKATHEQVKCQINLESSIYGYNHSGAHKSTGKIAFDSWLDNSLDFNIVDSSSSRGNLLLPSILRELNIANDVESEVWFSYVLTLAAVQSKVHIDPPFGCGWQFLTEGTKEWTIIDADFFDNIVVPVEMSVRLIDDVPVIVIAKMVPINSNYHTQSTSRFSVITATSHDIPILVPLVLSSVIPSVLLPVLVVPVVETLLSDSMSLLSLQPLERRRYPGKYNPTLDYDVEAMASDYPNELYRATIGANDFLSCPLNWPHSVYTRDKACGLSGYMKYDLPTN